MPPTPDLPGCPTRLTLITAALLSVFSPPAAAQRTSISCPTGNSTTSWLTFGSPNLAATIQSPLTCTAQMKVLKGTPFITVGIAETYNYFTDADAALCNHLSCGPVTQTLTLTGPAGQLYAYPAPDSGAVNEPPTGTGWQTSGPSTICFDGIAPCPNDYSIWGFPSNLGKHQQLQATRHASLFFDTADMAKNGDVFLEWNYNLQASNNWLPLSLSIYYQTEVRFYLYQKPQYQPYTFRPRDARDGSTSACNDFPGDCHPSFSVWTQLQNPPLPGSGDPLLAITFNFTLERPTFRSAWLSGTSTNYGADQSSDPDYLFESSQNGTLLAASADGLSINSPPVAYGDHPLVVTSRDYGGSANLRARVKVDYNGTVYTYEVPVADPSPAQWLPTPPPWTGPACAGTGSFLPLPLDRDCNGIADWWEGNRRVPREVTWIPSLTMTPTRAT